MDELEGGPMVGEGEFRHPVSLELAEGQDLPGCPEGAELSVRLELRDGRVLEIRHGRREGRVLHGMVSDSGLLCWKAGIVGGGGSASWSWRGYGQEGAE